MKAVFEKTAGILFQGDSVTDCDRIREDGGNLGTGYPEKAARIYDALFPDNGIRFLNRGVSGNRVTDLLERYEEDFAALKPDLVSVLIGINDTWRRYDSNDPTAAADFEEHYFLLLHNLKRDLPDARIVIIEPFLLEVTAEQRAWREDLDPKIQAVRRAAEAFADSYIPMDGIFARYIADGVKRTELAVDGVHPTPLGHAIIAEEWLRALGVFGY
ncbi:lipase [Spirochaetia bacterium]|nr:lipase [Spirochaetia bacterium]